MKKDIMKLVKGIILAAMITVSVGSAFAFNPAPANPPANNTDEPINVGVDPQGKGISPNTYTNSLLNIKGTFSAEKMLVFFDAIINGQLTVGSLSQSNNIGLPWTNGKEPVCATTNGTLVLCGSPAGPTVTLTATPASISSGSSSTLTWTSSNTLNCSNITGTPGGQNIVATTTSGTASTGNLTTTTIYSITCTASDGTIATATATVTVTSAQFFNLIAHGISFNPLTVTVGVPVTFSAVITNNGNMATPLGQNFVNSLEIPFAVPLYSTVTTPPVIPALVDGASVTINFPSYVFTSPGTYTVKVCADKNQEVQIESNESWTDNCKTAPVTVSAAPMSDLVAGAVTHSPDPIYFQSGNNNPNPGTVNVTFNAVVTNQGNIATNNGAFRNIFQFAEGANGFNPQTPLTNANEATPTTIGPLGANVGLPVSSTRTFYRTGGGPIFSPGTHSVRVCADNNASWVGVVANEASETNNCGPWKNFTIEMPDILVAYAPTLSDNTILPGDEVAMTAIVFNIGGAPTCYPNTAGCFRNVFQWSTDPTFPTNNTNYITTGLISLTPNSNATITTGSPGIEFNTPGTYYVRACGDNSTNNGQSTGLVTTEASETNNCGLSAVLTVGALTLTANLTVSPTVGLTSQTFVLTATAGGNVSGTPQYQFKCKTADTYSSWQNGNTFSCTYATGGTYTPMVQIRKGSPYLYAIASTTVDVVSTGVWEKTPGTYTFTVGTPANCPTCNIKGLGGQVVPVTMKVWGGGGGGGAGKDGNNTGNGGGGGGGGGAGGAYNSTVVNITIPSSGVKTYYVTVGAGGAGGVGFTSGAGGQTKVSYPSPANGDVFLYANGGTGGVGGGENQNGGAGGTGGTGSSGSTTGINGTAGANGGTCDAGIGGTGGPGGNSLFGNGGNGGHGGYARGVWPFSCTQQSYNNGRTDGVAGGAGHVKFTW